MENYSTNPPNSMEINAPVFIKQENPAIYMSPWMLANEPHQPLQSTYENSFYSNCDDFSSGDFADGRWAHAHDIAGDILNTYAPANPDEFNGNIPKYMTEMLVDGIFNEKTKKNCRKMLRNFESKAKILSIFEGYKKDFTPSVGSQLDMALTFFRADLCRWLLVKLRTRLLSNRNKISPCHLRNLSFPCSLPLYLTTFFEIGQRNFGLKKASRQEGHSTWVMYHVIDEEADLYCLGFGKNWSKMQDKNTIISYRFLKEEEFKEEVKGNVKCMRPRLFKLEYHINTQTMYINADINNGLF